MCDVVFLFPNPKTIEVAGIKIGGQPGENPPVLIGTMFYERHKILNSSGFDKGAAEILLNRQAEKSDETKIPSIVNVFGDSRDSFWRRIEFVADHCKLPIMIDSPDYGVRVAAIEYAQRAGLSKRIIYNSLNLSVNMDEIEALKDSPVNSAIILAYNPTDSSLLGKLKFLEKDGAFGKGLLDIAKDAGIKNMLIDTAVTPLYHGAGISMKSLIALKAKFGYPVGCGIHNAVASWDWLSKRESKKFVDVASNMIPVILGADFVLYGPIENAAHVFDAVAFAEIIAEEAMEDFVEVKGLGL